MMCRIACAICAFLAIAPSVAAQQVPPSPKIPTPPARQSDSLVVATLSLQEAVELARRNNPEHLITANDIRTANAAIRSARGQFLPAADASFALQRQEAGRQIFQGSSFGARSDVNQSQYRLGLGYQLNTATFVQPKAARANRDAVEANIARSAEAVRADVTTQYLTVLQAEERARLQDTVLAAANAQLVLAKARSIVGSGTELDVRRAEIAVGQQEVQVLQSRNQVETEKLNLFLRIGVPKPPNVALSTRFDLERTPPPLELLLRVAQQDNPSLEAARARLRASDLNVRVARSQYTPTLSLSTGLSGYTYSVADPNFIVSQTALELDAQRTSCIRTEEVRAAVGLSNDLATCQAFVLTDEARARIRRENSGFPFRFQRSPYSVSASLSLPLFNGFIREQQIENALVASSDAQYDLRRQELATTALVTSAYLSLETAARVASLQAQNSAKARVELKFAQDRYRNGLITFVDLSDARAAYERAEADRINAIYDFHKAFTALESAVGRPLRQESR